MTRLKCIIKLSYETKTEIMLVYHGWWQLLTGIINKKASPMTVMVGGEWGRFYFLAGVKVSAALYSPATRNWSYEGERDYSIFYETIITDQDQDPTRLPPLRYERPVTLDVMGALEIGGRLNSRDDFPGFKRNPNPRTDYYLAAYADYALWSSSPFNMLEIGVRLTVQWRIRKQESCHCMTFEAL